MPIFDLSRQFPPADRTLPCMLSRQAERFGDKTLLQIGEHSLSFDQCQDLAARMAGALAGAGIVRGDRVAVICSNRIELIALLLGCGWMGAVRQYRLPWCTITACAVQFGGPPACG